VASSIMNRIIIEAVSQDAMRPPYDQGPAGDWLYDRDGTLVIRSTGTSFDDPETFLFALHELVEAYLCRCEGVEQRVVDAFDKRIDGQIGEDDEHGDHPEAPYRTQHRRAMLIEMLMAQFLGLDGYGTIR